MKTLIRDAAIWGSVLWLIGYVLGIALFFVVPTRLIGWVITPIGASLAVWVILTRVRSVGLAAHLIVAIAWTAIAIVGDYLFIVKLLAPADGYYKPDVYLYYGLTFVIAMVGALVRPDASRREQRAHS